VRAGAVAVVLAALAAAGSASSARPDRFVVRPLVTDRADPQLVNAWGLAARAGGAWWVANEARSSSTIYAADGRKQALRVSVPGGPTGVVFNGGPGFVVRGGGVAAPARFVYACEDGMIRGWSPMVPRGWSTQAEVAVDASGSGAVFRGLALARGRLYATDFHNGRVDVFDGNFMPIHTPGAFTDPNIPAGFAPFGIQNIGDQIFVTYAKQDADAEDDVAGQGLGFVDVFDRNGVLLDRVAQRGQLNAPWGLAMAPDDFGTYSGDLLVGNFGDGNINAFTQNANGTWRPAGQLRGADQKPIKIDGLWALQFGHGALANNGPRNTLFFTAGPNDENDGLFGSITAVP
jgi:uncharacterized protein (TIGR03118 family)